jgi:molecular chaperone Hsp33
VLTRHDYPEPVANLLGEACALAALVGSSLKFEGRLIVQAQGDGPVRYVVADYDTSGGLRGYCRFDAEEVAKASEGFVRPGAKTLLGGGVFIMTLDQGADMDRYQGVTPIEGETLALCAEQYFAQSEQTPTRVRLAVGQVDTARAPVARRRHPDPEHRRRRGARRHPGGLDPRPGPLRDAGEDELIDPTCRPRPCCGGCSTRTACAVRREADARLLPLFGRADRAW